MPFYHLDITTAGPTHKKNPEEEKQEITPLLDDNSFAQRNGFYMQQCSTEAHSGNWSSSVCVHLGIFCSLPHLAAMRMGASQSAVKQH